MRKTILIGILLTIFISFSKGQDKIVKLNRNSYYVDKIEEIKNDSIYYIMGKKHLKLPLSNIKGYYITISTEENLKKRPLKRETEYHEVDPVYHKPATQENIVTDLVVDYINKKLPKNFLDLDYIDGYIITLTNDTVMVKISSHVDQSVFIIVNDSLNNFTIHTAKSIRGYKVNNILYLSLHEKISDNKISYCFIRQEIDGYLNLFYKPSLPYSKLSYYLINKLSTGDLYVFSLSDGNGIPINTGGTDFIIVPRIGMFDNSGILQVRSNAIDLSYNFKKSILELINDCESVSNKVKTDFYTRHDFKTIINEYNNCK